jgi:hypothetical protein
MWMYYIIRYREGAKTFWLKCGKAADATLARERYSSIFIFLERVAISAEVASLVLLPATAYHADMIGPS